MPESVIFTVKRLSPTRPLIRRRPLKRSRLFPRVHLKAGETKSLTLYVKRGNLAVWGADRKWEVEPGEFTAMVGGSSATVLTKKFILN